VLVYVLLWTLTIGFVAGDVQVGYNLAIASALIPFALLNVAAFGIGLIASSQKYRAALAVLAESLSQELISLEKIRNKEVDSFRSIFGGELQHSPTSASVIMREAASNGDYQHQVVAIEKATEIWKLTSSSFELTSARVEMQSS
jgi:hypothetical protein